MSSVGQVVGGIVGTVIGFFVGYPMLGASIGMMIGGYLDPPKGPKVEGPRLKDLSQQISAYGVAVPRVYGTCALAGNVVWIENNALKEVSKEESQGGKGGGGGSTSTTYTYYATFALLLCEGPIDGIGRIWINGKLYGNNSATDLSTIMATKGLISSLGDSKEGGGGGGTISSSSITTYLGTDTQLPDPRMQATLGVANTPSYRGFAYLVVSDFDLTDYGNTLVGAQFKVEVIHQGSSSISRTALTAPFSTPHTNVSFSPKPYIGPAYIRFFVPQWEAYYPATSSYKTVDLYPDGTVVNGTAIECPGTAVPPSQFCESGVFLYSATQVFTANEFSSGGGHIHERNGLYAGLSVHGLSGSSVTSIWVSRGSPTSQVVTTADSDAKCIFTDGIYIWTVGASAIKQYLASDMSVVATGAGLSGLSLSDSRMYVDFATGHVYVMPLGGASTIYRYSLDLSSVSLYASGLNITSNGYASNNFTIVNDFLVVAVGGTPDISPKTNYVWLYNLSVMSAADVPLSDIVEAEVLKTGFLTSGDIVTTSLTDMVKGYRVASVGAVREALEPLQGSWPFDVINDGYKLKFIRRGVLGSVATIASTELDAHPASDNAGVMLTSAREMETQLPAKVIINGLNQGAEYEVSSQYAERLGTQSVNIVTLEMPIVLTVDEMAQKADILLGVYWRERWDYEFHLPPSYLALQPADIITITMPYGTYVLRLTSIEYMPDGILACKARPVTNATYSSNAVGVAPAFVPAQTIPFSGSLMFEFLDVPVMRTQYDQVGFAGAMCAVGGDWVGGTLWSSPDMGQTWSATNGFTTEATVGYLVSGLITPTTFSLMDKASTLTVELYDGELDSVTELQMLNGANHFAVGADGRWEIIAAQTCALQSDGTYLLTNLMRGRFGTERYAAHSAGDLVVLMDENALQYRTLNTSQIGLSTKYRALANGRVLDSVADVTYTYAAANLKPLSPVYPAGSKNPSTNDWAITWIRRSRNDGEWRDSVDAGLGETSEAYEVEIYSSGTYQTLKRTITGLTSPTCTYTSAQQTTDFGGVQTQLYVKIYQLSSVVGRGAPLAAPIPYKHSTLGVYHLDSLPFKNEVTGATVSPGGNGTLSTSTGVRFGAGCFYANSAGYLWLSFANATALADFTLEMWITGQTGGPMVEGNINVYNNQLRLAGGYGAVVTNWPAQDIQTKSHFAVSRKAGVIKVFFNGIQKNADVTNNTVMDLSSLALGYFAGGPVYSYAYFDEVRLSDVCLYSENFTPPSAPFTLPSGVW